MFGAFTFGSAYFSDAPSYTTQPTTRPDCGGVFGTVTFGSRYFGGHIQCNEPPPPVPTTRPNCGGIFGTATFGQAWFGAHLQCPMPVPPVPPTPPSPGGGGMSIGYPRPKRLFDGKKKKPRAPTYDDGDEEDIAVILTAWLNVKK